MDQKKTNFDSSELTFIHSNDVVIFDVENTSSENQNGLQEIDVGSGSGAPSKKMNLNELKAKQIVDFSAEGSSSGFKLAKTPSFVSLLETGISQPTKEHVTARQATPRAHPQTQGLASAKPARQETTLGNASAPPQRKSKKASNFHFALIKIGNWERKASYHKDLLAKIDYSRRKLLWEILDDKLKTKMKIEIKWSDILSMRAVLNDHRNDTLEVELDVPPIYFVEGEPKPKKYISWVVSTDFTGEQANLYRIHRLQLGAGKLKKHYQKFVQWDDSTLSLSKKKFPSAPTPYFDVINQTPLRSLGYRPTHPIQFQQFHYTRPPLIAPSRPPLITPTSSRPPLIAPTSSRPLLIAPTRPPLIAPTSSRNPEVTTQYQYPLLSFRQPAPITSQQPQQLQYLIQPIAPPPMGTISSPPPVFICNRYCAYPVLSPASGNTDSTGMLILPRAPVWPSGQTIEGRLMNQFVHPVQQVPPTVQVPHPPQNSPSSSFQAMGANELNQTRSQIQGLPALPVLCTSPTQSSTPFSTVQQTDETHMNQNDLRIPDNFTETKQTAPALANNGEAPCPSLVPNEDVEISTNKMSFEEVEIYLLTDEPPDVHPNEEKILDEVNSMTRLLTSGSVLVADGSVVEDKGEVGHQKGQKDLAVARNTDADSYSSDLLTQFLLEDDDNDFSSYFSDYKSDRIGEVNGEVRHERVQHDLAEVETTTVADTQQSHHSEDQDDDFVCSFLDLSSCSSPAADQASV